MSEVKTCELCGEQSAQPCITRDMMVHCASAPTPKHPNEIDKLCPGDTIVAIVSMNGRARRLSGTVIGLALTNEVKVQILYGQTYTDWVPFHYVVDIEHTAPEGTEPLLLARPGDSKYPVRTTPAMSHARKLLTLVVAYHGRDVAKRLLKQIGIQHVRYLTPGSRTEKLTAACLELLPDLQQPDAPLKQYLVSK